MKSVRLLFGLQIFLFLVSYGGSGTQRDSMQQSRIIDSAELLSPSQEDSLYRAIQALEQSVGSQMAILTLKSLNGQDIETYSLEKSKAWGLGREQYDDGILITVAYEERRMRIEVGIGLEPVITNEIADRINREQLLPKFRERKFYEGLYGAVTIIAKLIGENKTLIRKKAT